MSSFDIKPNFDLQALSQRAEMFPKAAVGAMNRITREARTNMANDVSQRFNIKRTEVLDKITITPATQSNLVTRINAKSRRLTVMRFDARESGMAHGVVLQITRGSSKVITNAFVNKVPTGGYKGKLVLARTTDKRYPLEAIRTISISEMIGMKKIGEKVNELMTKRLPEELGRLITLWGK